MKSILKGRGSRMRCRECDDLERKTYGVWRRRVTGAHLSAEDLDADYPCPRDSAENLKRTRSSGIMEELMACLEPKAPRMREMWEKGATALEIALTIDCGKGIVENFIARFERGAAKRREEAAMDTAEKALDVTTLAGEGNGEAKPLTKDELYARIAEMRRRGARWTEIQRELGVNPSVVHAALERHGLLKKGMRRAKLEQDAAPEKPRPLIAGLAKTLAGGAAAQFLRGIGSSLELLPGRFRVSVRIEEVEEVQDNVQG